MIDQVRDEPGFGSMKFNMMAGVVDRAKMGSFERLLWRVSKGNVFVKFADIDEPILDPNTGNALNKVVFMIFFAFTKQIMKKRRNCTLEKGFKIFKLINKQKPFINTLSVHFVTYFYTLNNNMSKVMLIMLESL